MLALLFLVTFLIREKVDEVNESNKDGCFLDAALVLDAEPVASNVVFLQ